MLFSRNLYRAIIGNISIRCLPLPNDNVIKILGYADDSNIFAINDQAITQIFTIVNPFENATGCRLNRNKTKIFGFGSWGNKDNWPIPWLNSVTGSFTTLGISVSNDYCTAVDLVWSGMIRRIKNTLASFHSRKLTLYQKATIANSLLLSKIWYVSHVYLLLIRYSKLISKEIFFYIWGRKCEFIKRDTLTKPKKEGGIGLINLLLKAHSIYASSFLKMYFDDRYNFMSKYYISSRTHDLFDEVLLLREASPTIPSNYLDVFKILVKFKELPNFPLIKAKVIYNSSLPSPGPTVESKYPLYNWPCIWENISLKFIVPRDRDIIYKYLHEILPNRKRLKEMRITNDPKCPHCDVEESNIHMVYFCIKVKNLVLWLKNALKYFCNFQNCNYLKILYFDLPKVTKLTRNTAILVISSYIVNIWLCKEKNLSEGNVINKIRANILLNQKYNTSIYKENMCKMFTSNYCNIDCEAF